MKEAEMTNTIEKMLEDKIILITGGTGSFGNAVSDRFLKTGIREIRIFSRDEKKQDDMRKKLNDSRFKFFLGDVRDKGSLNYAMRDVNYVFHAAALKQVPSCEFYPLEALKTNVVGTANMIDIAVGNDVKKAIILSTDKAVYPINAMGMTKALAEKVMIAKSRMLKERNQTLVCGTRYGNVMASRGSVIPLFISQIKNKKPITITDPEMTRFMMSLEDSVNLVLFAFQNGRQGDLFVQKAPAATIGTLATALKKLFSADNEVRIIGTRHGEKKHETLLNREEFVRSEDLGDYYRVYADARDLNYEQFFDEGQESISSEQDYTSFNTKRLDEKALIELLLTITFVQRELKDGS